MSACGLEPLHTKVAASDRLLVVLLRQDRPYLADDGRPVGKTPTSCPAGRGGGVL
jgi:hypothetical protein